MPSLPEIYAETLHDNLKLFPTWPVGNSVAIGDYGPLKDDIFSKKGNINDEFGITVATRDAGKEASANWIYKSDGVQETKIDAGTMLNLPGAAPVRLNAGLKIGFKNAKSVYFRAANCLYRSIDNQVEVSQRLLALFDADKWRGDHVLVTGVFLAGATTVIISAGKNASITIEAKTKAARAVDLGNASVGLSTRSELSLALNVVANPGLVPLFTLASVQPRNWLDYVFSTEAGRTVRPLVEATQWIGVISPPLWLFNKLAASISPQVARMAGRRVEDIYDLLPLP